MVICFGISTIAKLWKWHVNNLNTGPGREAERLLTGSGKHTERFLACLPEIGGRRLAILKKQLATVSKRCNPKHIAEEKNRVCIAKQIPHVWLDQVGVFNTCYCSGMYVLSSLV